jgi:hypothetical protein
MKLYIAIFRSALSLSLLSCHDQATFLIKGYAVLHNIRVSLVNPVVGVVILFYLFERLFALGR